MKKKSYFQFTLIENKKMTFIQFNKVELNHIPLLRAQYSSFFFFYRTLTLYYMHISIELNQEDELAFSEIEKYNPRLRVVVVVFFLL
jgi:flagellar basal body-associated protein FliL